MLISNFSHIQYQQLLSQLCFTGLTPSVPPTAAWTHHSLLFLFAFAWRRSPNRLQINIYLVEISILMRSLCEIRNSTGHGQNKRKQVNYFIWIVYTIKFSFLFYNPNQWHTTQDQRVNVINITLFLPLILKPAGGDEICASIITEESLFGTRPPQMAKCLMFLSRCVAFCLPSMGCVHNHCLMSKIEGKPCKLWMPPLPKTRHCKDNVCRHLCPTLETSSSLALRPVRRSSIPYVEKTKQKTFFYIIKLQNWRKRTFVLKLPWLATDVVELNIMSNCLQWTDLFTRATKRLCFTFMCLIHLVNCISYY